MNPAEKASAKGLSGNTEPSRSIHVGSSPIPKIPEMNDSRIRLALQKALAALGVGASEATARPSAEKQAVPTTNVSTSAGTFSQMISTS